MIGWTDGCLLAAAAMLLLCGCLTRLRHYRSLLLGSGILLLITALFPRPGNLLGQRLFAHPGGAPRLPLELFGVSWWILGAWLVKSLLDLVLHRTLFPDDDEPHARRLLADLASGLIYLLAFIGIMDTVLKVPITAVLATSGVLAIVLGLALQNTLADVFSGLAINIERPFGAGDWITVSDHVEGLVMEINWRATRIRTRSNDMIVIPNSVVAKATVTNHRRHIEPHLCLIALTVDQTVPAARVIGTLQSAAARSPGIAAGTTPRAYACSITDAMVAYELTVAVEDFTLTPDVQSEVIGRVIEAFTRGGIQIGSGAMDVRLHKAVAAVAPTRAAAPSGRTA
jgi:small-conductance mechanosensitive channel